MFLDQYRARNEIFESTAAISSLSGMPAVDFTETEKGYKVVAELPGMDDKNIEVKIASGMLTIKGEKQEERQEEKRAVTCRCWTISHGCGFTKSARRNLSC
jgi:HSP20 family molecular chaperone IbpA